MPISGISSASGSVVLENTISNLNYANKAGQVAAPKEVAAAKSVTIGEPAAKAKAAQAQPVATPKAKSSDNETAEASTGRLDIMA